MGVLLQKRVWFVAVYNVGLCYKVGYKTYKWRLITANQLVIDVVINFGGVNEFWKLFQYCNFLLFMYLIFCCHRPVTNQG